MDTKQKEKLKKIGIFFALALLFLLSMWFIFKPSESEKAIATMGLGLNENVPQPVAELLPQDKTQAYEQNWHLEKKEKRKEAMRTLSDVFDNEMATQPHPFPRSSPQGNAINRSVAQYQSTHRALANFYQEKPVDEEKEQLKEELKALEERLKREQESQNSVNEQLALMEKSYEMASKYMPQMHSNNPMPLATQENVTSEKKTLDNSNSTNLPMHAVQSEKENTVSALYQEIPTEERIEQQSAERNRAFYSLHTKDKPITKNTLRVCVHITTVLKEGESVSLRLLENAIVGEHIIPKNTLLTATAKIQGNRLVLHINSLAYKEQVIGVKLSAFELDGQEGVFIPGSSEMNALKEVAANMGSSAGQSFTFSSSAGQQLTADVGKGLLQGTSKYLSKKLREVKVTLKSGHLLYLVQKQ